LKKSLGIRIRSLRVEHRMTQEDLADAAGLHVTYLSMIEHGKRNPSLQVLQGIAKALRSTLSSLFEGL
jgi:transcriptional regulator with XRE-family HTH domain